MAFFHTIGRAMDALFGPTIRQPGQVPIPPTADLTEREPSEFYQLLRSLYYSNGLYDRLARSSFGLGLHPDIKRALRNPTFRVVEFYVAKIWGGTLDEALGIDADNARIIEPIQQIWTWSNWASRKQVATRTYAMLGDLFLKVAQPDDGKRVFLQRIEPDYVRAFDTDERGFIIWIRVDTPKIRRLASGQAESYTHIEVWDKANSTAKIWETQQPEADVDQLGEPTESHELSEFGIDFVPFVHAPFKDVGDDRGMAAVTPAIDKIDEANTLATTLHRLLFRHGGPTWALSANMVDSNGRPLAPPIVGGWDDDDEGGVVTLGDDRMMRLPGMASLESLIPQIDYDAALAILAAQLQEIERDLPELAYYSLGDSGADLSGTALRYMLTDAVDRVIEAKGNADAALIRANQMALTIAAYNRLDGFTGLGGTYESGAFDHQFKPRDVIPLSESEEAQALATRGNAAVAFVNAGYPQTEVYRLNGYSEDEIARLKVASAEQAASRGGDLLDALNGKTTPQPTDAEGRTPDDVSKLVAAATALIRAGFAPEAALRSVGLDPVQHLGLLPVTVKSPADV